MTGATRVFITGAGGLVGSALVEELDLSSGFAVTAPTRGELDLLDRDATEAAVAQARPDIVFHLAAKVAGIGGNLARPGEMIRDNLLINTNVVEAARAAGAAKVVAVGSAAIYADTVELPMAERDIWNGPPHHSEAAYGHAKRALLAQLEAYQVQYGLDYAYCVLTNTYGPRDRFDERHGHVVPSLVSKFARAVAEGGEVELWGTGRPSRDFLYVDDVARALRLIAERGHGAINVASGATVTIRELVETVARVAGFDGRLRWDASKPDGQMLRAYDVDKLFALGFRPTHDLAQGLARTFDWYRRHGADARREQSFEPARQNAA